MRGGNGNEDVGYKKPPVIHRFQKGRSGNPAGRPRRNAAGKPLATTTDLGAALADELTRPIAFQSNGRQEEAPATALLARSQVASGIKGDGVAARNSLAIAMELHRQQQDAAMERLGFWHRYGEAKRAARRRGHLNSGSVNPLPHPDDIDIIPETGEVRFMGPVVPEDVPWFQLAFYVFRLAMCLACQRFADAKIPSDPVVRLYLAYALLAYESLAPSLGGRTSVSARWPVHHRVAATWLELSCLTTSGLAAERAALESRIERCRAHIARTRQDRQSTLSQALAMLRKGHVPKPHRAQRP